MNIWQNKVSYHNGKKNSISQALDAGLNYTMGLPISSWTSDMACRQPVSRVDPLDLHCIFSPVSLSVLFPVRTLDPLFLSSLCPTELLSWLDSPEGSWAWFTTWLGAVNGRILFRILGSVPCVQNQRGCNPWGRAWTAPTQLLASFSPAPASCHQAPGHLHLKPQCLNLAINAITVTSLTIHLC